MKKDLDLLGLTWDEALDLTKDRSEWGDCTASARCASTARGSTKVYGLRHHQTNEELFMRVTIG